MFQINVIFSLDIIFSERKRLTVFQKALLSVTYFTIGYYSTAFWFLLIVRHNISFVLCTYFYFHFLRIYFEA